MHSPHLTGRVLCSTILRADFIYKYIYVLFDILLYRKLVSFLSLTSMYLLIYLSMDLHIFILYFEL